MDQCLENADLICRDASEESGVVCPQVVAGKELAHFCFKAKVNLTLGGLNNGGLHESSNEDCLFLNIYVPEVETRCYNFILDPCLLQLSSPCALLDPWRGLQCRVWKRG